MAICSRQVGPEVSVITRLGTMVSWPVVKPRCSSRCAGAGWL
ncbi:MAG: hypothetical protein U0232_22670 [Thermomicrobiales bacterium]